MIFRTCVRDVDGIAETAADHSFAAAHSVPMDYRMDFKPLKRAV